MHPLPKRVTRPSSLLPVGLLIRTISVTNRVVKQDAGKHVLHFHLRYFKAVYIILNIYQPKPDGGGGGAILTSVQSNVCYVA